MYKALLLSFSLVALEASGLPPLPPSPSGAEPITAKTGFDRLQNDFIEAWWKENPEDAVAVGYYRYADQLPAFDVAGRRRSLAFADLWLGRFKTFGGGKLPVQERIDLDLIRNQLETMRWRISSFKEYQWNPAIYNVGDAFGLILGTEYAPLEARLRTVARRLKQVPAYYAAAQANIRNPTLEHTELAIMQNKGALTVFGEAFMKQVDGSKLSASEKVGIKAEALKARVAIEGYLAFLEARAKASDVHDRRSFRIGKQHFEEGFALIVQADCSAEQLYRRALGEKEKLHAQMDGLTQKLWPAYFGAEPWPADRLERISRMVGKLSAKHVEAGQFVAEVKRQIPLLERWVIEHDLVALDPDKPLVVRETPEYMRGIAGASLSSPGPYDPKANSYYNVTPLEGTPAEQESTLREYNDYILQILNIHEAVPGHYVQLLHANKSPSLIKAIFGNGAMSEGWAVYAERMMLESGYGGDTPEMWLMYAKWSLRVVCNTILDYGIHVEGMTEPQAMRLLVGEAFQEEAEVKEKWHRAQVSSVQLSSYFAGYSAIHDLRETLKARHGARFDLKAFHEELLSYGSAPVKFIRQLMLK